MFYSTHVRRNGHSERTFSMLFALTLALVLVLSSAYLVHQWYTDELSDPGP